MKFFSKVKKIEIYETFYIQILQNYFFLKKLILPLMSSMKCFVKKSKNMSLSTCLYMYGYSIRAL